MKYSILILALVFTPLLSTAQSTWKSKKQKISHAQGTLFGYWGYNRSAYTESNMRFVGPGYDFTLSGAKAHDNQSPLSSGYYWKLKSGKVFLLSRVSLYIHPTRLSGSPSVLNKQSSNYSNITGRNLYQTCSISAVRYR